MSTTIRELKNKLEEFEDRLINIEKQSKSLDNELGFTISTNNYNSNIITSKRFRLKQITNSKSQVFIQAKINIYNFNNQNIKLKLFANNIQIASEELFYEQGVYTLTIFGIYKNNSLDPFYVDLFISPKNNNQINISNITLSVWGVNQEEQTTSYEALETNNYYLLSYNSSNTLHYKIFKKTSNVDDIDFKKLKETSNYSLCNIDDEIFLFRINSSGSLFFSNIENQQEYFITNNVSCVSCCNFNDLIIFSYISNSNCYYGEIQNNVVISNKKITFSDSKFTDCKLYFNKYNQKCYLIITNSNGNNYLLENINETFSSHENINSIINFSAEIIGDNL